MSRYARSFELLRTRGEGAFGAFLMLGDPDCQTSALLLDAPVTLSNWVGLVLLILGVVISSQKW